MKNINIITAILFTIAIMSQVTIAQSPNVATLAACTHSSGGTGYPSGYGPEHYNDGINPTQGGYFGWTTTSSNPDPNAYIQFDWGSNVQSIGELTLYYVATNTRYMQSARIQYWTGSAWVNHYDFNVGALGLIKVITFPSVTTTRLRITNMSITGSQASNPNFHEIELRSTVNGFNNAGISALTSPIDFCAGTLPVEVTLVNAGYNQITSATIKWTLNGVPQPDYYWTGLLDTVSSTSRRTQVVLNPAMTFSSSVPYAFKIWTHQPNGQPDTINFNDTLTTNRKSAIAGTYTIGGSSPDYSNFTSAVADLNANGLCGPVTFNVRSGVYTEQISLESITGASATNTVIFQSESGNRNDVILTYAPTSTTDNWTVKLSNADYIIFQNMTIRSTGSSYSNAIVFAGGSDHNSFINCILQSSASTSTSNYNAVIYSTSGTMDEYNQFIGNNITGGSYGVYWMGSSSTAAASERENIFDSNIVTGQYYMGMYTYYQNTITVKDNAIIRDGGYSGAYLLYAYYYFGPYKITGNKLIAKNITSYTYGIMNYANGSTNSPSNRPIIANNFIKIMGTSTNYGMYLYYTSYANIFHNTVYNASTYSSAYSIYSYYNDNMRFKNNIVYNANTAGYVIRDYGSTGTIDWDNNIYYQGGTYFAYIYPAGTTYNSFALYQAGTGRDVNSKNMTVQFADPNNGDLHLAGASQNDMNMIGVLVAEVTDDIDKDPRVLPYIGADEACYILPSTLSYEFKDSYGKPLAYVNTPGQIYFNYNFAFPDFAMTTTVTLNFVNVVTNQTMWTTNFQINKLYGQSAIGTYTINIPSTIPPGTYKIDVILNTKNSCDAYQDYALTPGVLLIVPQGQIPCVVWPGDANNDGIVNYGDRSGLNKYIIQANLNSFWLQGPGRYRADYTTNPLTYYTWTAQPSVPWNTAMGCYMDTDGNGIINSFDYLAIKINWMRTHGVVPKQSRSEHGIIEVFPVIFSAYSNITINIEEESNIKLELYTIDGKYVKTILQEKIFGTKNIKIDSNGLLNGVYIIMLYLDNGSFTEKYSHKIQILR
jgi:hypothetical protein